MNKELAYEFHVTTLREMVARTLEVVDEHTRKITDDAGRVITACDDGTVTVEFNGKKFSSNGINTFREGKLTKDNGYVYCSISSNDFCRDWKVGQHVVIAMMFKPEEFDAIYKLVGGSVVVNHMNNRGYYNKLDNLEWVSQGVNAAHGALIKTLHDRFGNKYIEDIVYNHSVHYCLAENARLYGDDVINVTNNVTRLIAIMR